MDDEITLIPFQNEDEWNITYTTVDWHVRHHAVYSEFLISVKSRTPRNSQSFTSLKLTFLLLFSMNGFLISIPPEQGYHMKEVVMEHM